MSSSVVVGLSGGVDSAVSAYLLLEQGYNVRAVFMQNWDDQEDGHCSVAEDYAMAKAVAAKLNISLDLVNFSREYYQKVFSICLDAFQQGYTPNPDILCNQEIKFKLFLDHALSMGADFVATGHYAQIIKESGQYKLLKANEMQKDQTYFLCRISQYALRKTLFPLGVFQHKEEIRQLAKEIGLPNYNKKDSTGICFIGERPFKSFLKTFILPKPGHIVDENGAVLGSHDGLMFYTIGQRSGLKLGGLVNFEEKPWYVIEKNIEKNQLIVGQGDSHPKLFTKTLIANQPHWIGPLPSFPLHCSAKIRYRQNDVKCMVSLNEHQILQVSFSSPQKAVTPGQAIVFYDQNVCMGGATIAQDGMI